MADAYTPGRIDTRWPDEIEEAFLGRLKTSGDLLMSLARIEKLLRERAW